jgi:hypothetical protein
LVLVTSAAVTTLMTWPMVPRLGSVGRLDTGDGRFSIWNVGWVGHALLTSPRQLLDANIFWPHTGTLAYSELNLVAGVLGLPAFLVTHNALAAHNAAVLTALMLCLILTWRLVGRLTGSIGAGYVSAVLFTFCSFIWGHTAHVQLLMTFVLPLILLAFHRLHDEPTAGKSVQLGVALAVAALACGYYGIYGGIFLALLAVGLGRRELRYWIALAGAAVVAGAVLLPILIPYAHARDLTGVEPIRDTASMQIPADLQDYLTAPTMLENMIFRWHWTDPPHESLSPGLVLPVLVFVSLVTTLLLTLVKRRLSPSSFLAVFDERTRPVWAYAAATAVVIWASLGPSYGLYTVLMHVVPGMGFLRAPSRMGVVVALGLAVIAGFGTRGLLGRGRWVLPILVVLCVADRYTIWPWFDAGEIPSVYRVLATLPKGVVVDFPFAYVRNDFHRHTRAMYYSTADWLPRVNGFSDIIPQDFVDIAIPINDFPELSSFPLMHRYQVRYVVWQLEGYKADPVIFNRLTRRFDAAAPYLRPIAKDNDFWLYEIVAWPPGS